MSWYGKAIKRTRLDRAIDEVIQSQREGKGIDSKSIRVLPEGDVQILLALGKGSSTLPTSENAPDIKRAFMEEVVAAGESAMDAGPIPPSAERTVTTRRRLPALAVAAIILALIVIVVVGIGLGSVNAMPGSPLYSVKRWTESVRMAFTWGDEAKADAYLDQGEKRIEELEYAQERGMTDWYHGLSVDALTSIDNALKEAPNLSSTQEERVLSTADNLMGGFRASYDRISPKLTTPRRADIEDRIEVVEKRRRREITPPVQPENEGERQQPQPTEKQPQQSAPDSRPTKSQPDGQQRQQSAPDSRPIEPQPDGQQQ